MEVTVQYRKTGHPRQYKVATDPVKRRTFQYRKIGQQKVRVILMNESFEFFYIDGQPDEMRALARALLDAADSK